MRFVAATLLAVLPCLAAGPPADAGKAMGGPTAPVKIEIFSDFECPICKVFHEQTLPLLVRDYVVPGKVYIIPREFPLNLAEHKYSRQEAAYATAAARIGEYDKVASALFKAQQSIVANGQVWQTVASVLNPEQQKKIQALVKDPGVLAEVQAEYSYGASMGINGTPTLMISRGGKRYPIAGGMSYSLIKSLINDLLK